MQELLNHFHWIIFSDWSFCNYFTNSFFFVNTVRVSSHELHKQIFVNFCDIFKWVQTFVLALFHNLGRNQWFAFVRLNSEIEKYEEYEALEFSLRNLSQLLLMDYSIVFPLKQSHSHNSFQFNSLIVATIKWMKYFYVC